MSTSVIAFTRDLRVHDNPALAAVAASSDHVIPLFVLDDAILDRRGVNRTRLEFMLGSLRDLDASLGKLGGRLVIRRGPFARTVTELAASAGASSIHLAEDVSGYAHTRLAGLRELAESARIEVHVHPGVMVAGPEPLRAGAGLIRCSRRTTGSGGRARAGARHRPRAGLSCRTGSSLGGFRSWPS
jgi:deoxyribodipyrimidine photo-lyase